MDGLVIEEPKLIWEEEKRFYETLYTSKISLSDNEDFWDTCKNLPVVEESVALKCEGIITEAECREAMFSMPNDKTPGSDGLSANFCKLFGMSWKVFCVKFLTIVINLLCSALQWDEASDTKIGG